MFKSGMVLIALACCGAFLLLSGKAVIGMCSNSLGIIAALAVLGGIPGLVFLAIVYNSAPR